MKLKMKLTLLLTLLLPTLALAQAPSTSVIPYSGTLFSQGKPVSQPEAVLMAFALYSGDAVTALPAGSTNEAPDVALADESPSYNRLWTSWTTEDGTTSELSSLTVNNPNTVGVNVRNGRFLVHLGASDQTSLPNSVFDQRPLYVVTWVVNGSGVFRLPPQKLEKVPHAVTAERANSFEVMGDLNVEQNATVQGELTAHLGVKSNEAIYIDGNKVIDDNAGWHRSYGNTGWYNGTYEGGWYMRNSTYIENYNNKKVRLSNDLEIITGHALKGAYDMRDPNASIFIKQGNNGTVTCSDFCANPGYYPEQGFGGCIGTISNDDGYYNSASCNTRVYHQVLCICVRAQELRDE